MNPARHLVFLALPASLLAAAPAPPSSGDPIAEPLVKAIAEISAKDDPLARDYSRIAQHTIDFARRTSQGGGPINRNVIESALDAVDAGEGLDSRVADWPKLRSELKAFLEQKPQDQKPPPSPQDQDKDKEKSPEDQSPSPDSSGGNSKSPNESSPPPPSESGAPPKESPPGTPESKDQNGQPQPETTPPPPKDSSSAFGNMKGQQAEPPKPPEPSAETQKVGGQSLKEAQTKPADPKLTVSLQKLEMIRQQDSPAQLHQLMEGQRAPTTGGKGKNW